MFPEQPRCLRHPDLYESQDNPCDTLGSVALSKAVRLCGYRTCVTHLLLSPSGTNWPPVRQIEADASLSCFLMLVCLLTVSQTPFSQSEETARSELRDSPSSRSFSPHLKNRTEGQRHPERSVCIKGLQAELPQQNVSMYMLIPVTVSHGRRLLCCHGYPFILLRTIMKS